MRGDVNLFRFELEKTDDSGDLQKVSGLGVAGEQLDKAHRVMPFGLASNAPVGSHGIGLALHGRRELAVMLGVESHGKRPKNLPVGATALYGADGQILKYLPTKSEFDGGGKNYRQRQVEKIRLDANKEYWIYVPPGASAYIGAGPPWSRVLTEAGASPQLYASLQNGGPPQPEGVE